MLNFHPRVFRKRHGFNLVEAAIVLGVVGLVIGGIWVAASNVRENQLATQFVNGILLAKTEMQRNLPISMATGGPNYLQAGTSYTTIAKMGLVPGDWIKPDFSVTYPNGVHVTIIADITGGVPSIIMDSNPSLSGEPNLSPSLCIKIISRIVQADSEITAKVNGSYAYPNDPTTRTVDWVTHMCVANGPTTIGSMVLIFPLTAVN